MTPPSRSVDARGTIELHIREIPQLFDSFDPCPFQERDLDTDAEDYLVASVQELKGDPSAVVVHVDARRGTADEVDMLETAIQRHFQRKVRLATRDLHSLLQRGWMSLLIGLVFLISLLGIGGIVSSRLTAGPLASVLHESLLIGGWVAMWRPLEIFLYDWWPIVGQRRTYALLSQLPISIHSNSHPNDAGILQENDTRSHEHDSTIQTWRRK